MRVRTSLAVTLLLSLASGCFAEGRYVIRGTVKGAATGEGARPLEGAIVHVGSERRPARSDGSFDVPYWFTVGGGDPSVEIAAPGYRSCTFRLRAKVMPPGVTRASCEAPQHCFDVVLVPVDGPSAGQPGR